MAILLLIILLIVVGANVAYADDFAVIRSSVTLNGSSNPGNSYAQTIWNIDYPEGFNKDNCVVLAFGGKFEGEGFTYGYVENASASVAAVGGSISRTLTLNSDNIQAQAWNISGTEKVFRYRIVLMKVGF